MPENACVPRETLKQYLAGWTDADRSLEIESHLSHCAVCEETIVALEREPDTLVGLVAAAAAENPASHDQFRDALDQAAQIVDPALPAAASMSAALQIGPYQLLRPLGHGGMGAVYLAKHEQLGKQVAIKVLSRRHTHRQQFEARFQREIRAAGGLDHPSIVSATDAGQADGTHFLVMEFIDGIDLSHLARHVGPLKIADACELMRQVALGLSHAHAQGIVHRDIKPSNLMLGHKGQVKILDFGLARLGPWNEASAELTTVGQLMGTLDYMAPEQAERPESVDYRADLYSLGATLFRLLCGRPPLVAAPDQSPLAKLRMLATQTAPRLSTLRSDACEELTQLVERLLSRDPDQRPSSAAHVAEQLAPFCETQNLNALIAEASQRVSSAQAMADDEFETPAGQLVDVHGNTAAVADAARTNATDNRRGGRWGWIALACAALAAFAYSGLTLWIDGQKGWLHIESDAKVTVQLQSDGQPVKDWVIQPGPNSTRLYAGKYAIVLEQGSDSVQIENDHLQILQGGVAIARVVRRTTENSRINLSSESAPASSTIPPASTDVLRPGDRLQVLSQTDTTLLRDCYVQADNTVKLPLVGTVSVVDQTVDAFEDKLNELYKPFLERPGIEVYRQYDSAYGDSDRVGSQMVEDGSGSYAGLAGSEFRELMYGGRSLTEWLDTVQRDRSPVAIEEALRAIEASITSSTRDRIAETLRHFLPHADWPEINPRPAGPEASNWETVYYLAFKCLRQAAPEAYYPWLRTQLETSKQPTWISAALQTAIPFVQVTATELTPVHEWIARQVLSQSSPYIGVVASRYVQLVQSSSSSADRQFWLQSLTQSEQIKPLFWLEKAVDHSLDTPEFWAKVMQSAIATLADPQADNTSIVTACAAIGAVPAESQLFEEHRSELEEVWRVHAMQLANSPQLRASKIRPLNSEIPRRFYPDLNQSRWQWPNVAMNTSGIDDVYVTLALTQTLGRFGNAPDALVEALIPGAARVLVYAMPQLDCTKIDILKRSNESSESRWDIRLTGGLEGGSVVVLDWPVHGPSYFTERDVLDFLAFNNLYSPAWEDLQSHSETPCEIPILGLLFQAIEALQQQQQQAELTQLIRKCDQDHNGSLSYEEYEKLLGRKGQDTSNAALFVGLVDSNQDGQLSAQEILSFGNATDVTSLAKGAIEWSQKQISKYDKDADGKLSPDETKLMLNAPQNADANRDGFVDAMELAVSRRQPTAAPGNGN